MLSPDHDQNQQAGSVVDTCTPSTLGDLYRGGYEHGEPVNFCPVGTQGQVLCPKCVVICVTDLENRVAGVNHSGAFTQIRKHDRRSQVANQPSNAAATYISLPLGVKTASQLRLEACGGNPWITVPKR